MRVLVVDDEALALSRIERMLGELEVEHSAYSNELEALEYAKKNYFDVALLDINMPNIDGKELARRFIEINQNCFVVFQTAYDEHAVEAFRIGAIDYLLKPFSKEQLQASLLRAKEYRAHAKARFLIRQDRSSFLVEDAQIYYIEADLGEVIVRTKDEFLYLKQKISDIESKLPSNFFRIHRSFIINLDMVKEIETVQQSKLEFSFKGIKDIVSSSKDGAKKFRELFKE
ncbi:MAG: LytR/AlgR family response regulator transcription factor [Campylobacterales bacterium]